MAENRKRASKQAKARRNLKKFSVKKNSALRVNCTYMEKDFCLESGPVDPAELACLIFRVKTTIDRVFPANPKIDTVVKRTPSIM